MTKRLKREHVQTVLSDGGYLLIFGEAVKQAVSEWWQLIGDNPRLMAKACARERASFLNRRVIEIIVDKLADNPNVLVTVVEQTTMLTINNEINVRFKKLGSKKRPMSTLTNRNDKIWFRNAIPLGGEFSNWINVTLGFELSGGEVKALKEVRLMSEFGNTVEWFIDILSQANPVEFQFQPELVPLDDYEVPQPYVAKAKKTERSASADGDLKQGDGS